MSDVKFALVTADSAKTVWAYLPDNYVVFMGVPLGDVRNQTQYLVAGIDNAGWTLEGYVIPRLQSGLISSVAVSDERAVEFARMARS